MSVKTVNFKRDIRCLTNVISKFVNNTNKTHPWGTLSVLFQTDLQVHSYYRTTFLPVWRLIRYLLAEGAKQVIYGQGQFINRAKFTRPLPPLLPGAECNFTFGTLCSFPFFFQSAAVTAMLSTSIRNTLRVSASIFVFLCFTYLHYS